MCEGAYMCLNFELKMRVCAPNTLHSLAHLLLPSREHPPISQPHLHLHTKHQQDTLYHSFLQHLLSRLPARLADHVVGLLGTFATRES